MTSRSTGKLSTHLRIKLDCFDITEDYLRNRRSEHGAVNEIVVVKDQITEGPRGFAFSTTNTLQAGRAIIGALNGKDRGPLSALVAGS